MAYTTDCMLERIEHPDFTCCDAAPSAPCPQAALMIQALEGCCHPRAGRLLSRLRDHNDADQLNQLRADVLNLLVLSFGPAEARRRLQLQ